MTASQQQPSTAKVAGVVSFYMSAALVMVFVNKAVLNTSPDLPLLFLLIQLLIAVALLHGAALITPRVEIPKIDAQVALKLTPVIAVNIIGLVFNTLCLRDVDASFFQIARGMVLPLTIFVSSMHTRSIPAAKVLVAAALVTLGFLLGVAPLGGFSSLPSLNTASSTASSLNPSFISLVYGILSSLFIALHSVLIKSSLPHCNGSTIQLAYWTNLGSAIMLFPAVLFHGEIGRVMALSTVESWDGRLFVWGSIITGVFGFLLCVAALISIKVTSPITHMFSSAARSVIQTLLGVWLFSDVLTVNRAVSILVILLGTMYYTWVKHTESRSPPAGSSSAAYARLPTLEEIKVDKRDGPTHARRLSAIRESMSVSDDETVFDVQLDDEKDRKDRR